MMDQLIQFNAEVGAASPSSALAAYSRAAYDACVATVATAADCVAAGATGVDFSNTVLILSGQLRPDHGANSAGTGGQDRDGGADDEEVVDYKRAVACLPPHSMPLVDVFADVADPLPDFASLGLEETAVGAKTVARRAARKARRVAAAPLLLQQACRLAQRVAAMAVPVEAAQHPDGLQPGMLLGPAIPPTSADVRPFDPTGARDDGDAVDDDDDGTTRKRDRADAPASPSAGADPARGAAPDAPPSVHRAADALMAATQQPLVLAFDGAVGSDSENEAELVVTTPAPAPVPASKRTHKPRAKSNPKPKRAPSKRVCGKNRKPLAVVSNDATV